MIYRSATPPPRTSSVPRPHPVILLRLPIALSPIGKFYLSVNCLAPPLKGKLHEMKVGLLLHADVSEPRTVPGMQ